MNDSMSPYTNSQRGFTLIEVLAAVIVLSIGLLGLAALQASAVRLNHSAYLRTQATVLAQDIVDSMRTNRGSPANADSGLGGGYDIDLGDNAPTGTARNALDLQNWKTVLAGTLPSGDGAIDLDAGSRMVTVTVRWLDDRTAEANNGFREFVFRTQL